MDIVEEPIYKYGDTTGKIIGAAMEVHRHLGNGFPEIIYQRALAIELATIGLAFEPEIQIPVHYKGNEIGKRRVDFIVGELIPVELKAVSEITDLHFAQALNYLVAYNLEIGLLINFGAKSLQFKRLIHDTPHPYKISIANLKSSLQ